MSLSFFDAKIDSFSSICSEFIKKFNLLATLRAAGARKQRNEHIDTSRYVCSGVEG